MSDHAQAAERPRLCTPCAMRGLILLALVIAGLGWLVWG